MPDPNKIENEENKEVNEEQIQETNPLDSKKLKDFTEEELASCSEDYLKTRSKELFEWSKELKTEMETLKNDSKKQLNEANAKIKELTDYKESIKKQEEKKEEKNYSFDDFVH